MPATTEPMPQTERASERRPPSFVWEKPFPLNERISKGTLCVVRPILAFKDDDARSTKRVAVLGAWMGLQGDLYVRTDEQDFVCRIVGLDNGELDIRCHGDFTAIGIGWNDLEMIGAVVPFPDGPAERGDAA